MDEFRPGHPGMRYSHDHLWLRRSGEVVEVGVTDRVSRILTLVTSVSLPSPGASLEPGTQLCVIESQKATIELAVPCPLRVVEVNESLRADPMQVRLAPYANGWLLRAALTADAWARLPDEAAYRSLLAGS